VEDVRLPYQVIDADQHSNPGVPDMYERYIDPRFRDKAIRIVKHEGRVEYVYAGQPARLAPKNRDRFQVTFSDEQLEELGIKGAGVDESGSVVPGSLLNKLNPLKNLDDDARKEFVQKYRNLNVNHATPEVRLSILDMQGIEKTMNYLDIGLESNLGHDLVALYANQRAANRCYAEMWGFNYKDRIFSPPFISCADAGLALAELNLVMEVGTPIIQISTGPSIGRSPFRPEMDRFWAQVNEAGIRVCTHLADVTYYGQQGREWDEPEVYVTDMSAFQWAMYQGDRPAYETVAAAILQGWMSNFPNIKLLLSEQGSVWVPYLIRKMDHAFLMGRRATWGKLEMRPSDYFRQRVFVAPYPEENVERVVEAVGVDPIVFGSDFPHGEGLPDPDSYMPQLKSFSDGEQRQIMRDNMARFLGS
jgi:predicted TIM-barrel fold metal-dependent hydrolase